MSELEEFKKHVEHFLSAKQWTPNKFGLQAKVGPAFVANLRAGREPRSATRRKVLKFIGENIQK